MENDYHGDIVKTSKRVKEILKAADPEHLKVLTNFGPRCINQKDDNMHAFNIKEAIKMGRGYELPTVSEDPAVQKAFVQTALVTITYRAKSFTKEEREKNIPHILEKLDTHDQCSEEYDQACKDLNNALTPVQREVLFHLVSDGPIYDGDIISKSARNDLFDMGLAGRAHQKGEQGYSVANYRGGNVLKSVFRLTEDVKHPDLIAFKEKYPDEFKRILEEMKFDTTGYKVKRIIQNAMNIEGDEAVKLTRKFRAACWI